MADSNLEKFDHLVVLMLENRSLDNVLGYLYEHDAPQRFIGRGEPAFRGVGGRQDLWNPDDAEPPQRVYVDKAPWAEPADMCQPSPDPGELMRPNVNRQVFGLDDAPPAVAPLVDTDLMKGFVQDYIRVLRDGSWLRRHPTYDEYRVIMNCFPAEAVPVLSGLARAFAVSDEWFASVPSQTYCNRSFLHSGQSHGFVTNSDYVKWLDNDAPTVFDLLTHALGASRAWRLYWDHEDVFPISRLIHPGLDTAAYDDHFRSFEQFAADCRTGDLPAYTFIQPRLILNHNDMHPPVPLNPFVHSSVLAGERLVNDVYDAVRQGAHWERTLLVILFDEHGGCYDHCAPPRDAVPPTPTPPYPLEDGFRFDRFGVRVPAIFVSPYVAPGTVVRAPGATPFDHTSVVKTLCRRWTLPRLTGRDAAAPDFTDVLSLSFAERRLETPAMRPRPYSPAGLAPQRLGALNGLQRAVLGLMGSKVGARLDDEADLAATLADLRQKLAARERGEGRESQVR